MNIYATGLKSSTAEEYCNKKFEGTCEKSLRLESLSDKMYTREDCYHKCYQHDDCKAFTIDELGIDPVCDLFAAVCEKPEIQNNYGFYDMKYCRYDTRCSWKMTKGKKIDRLAYDISGNVVQGTLI